ncbi:leukemia inhibitory factor receptor-like [Echeneis naucrates]|uniref:leukemia inhibitory factor receptor-like n=1 Tax=Echeneis naucrates TaxID=173247 RepID=UPI001113E6B6|nr:leukemia inhibitory factor receptor-like [Echeneis naucrates]
MTGRGNQFDFSDSRSFSLGVHCHLVIFGLIFVYYTINSSLAETSSVKCKPENIFSSYQHCDVQPDGVHDLDCFSKYGKKPTCVWKAGNHSQEKTYSLIIIQKERRYCKKYINITNVPKSITIYTKFNLTAQVFEISDSRKCTKAVFSSSYKNLSRCGPPYHVSFRRQAGKLNVSVSWDEEDEEGSKAIQSFSVRYKTAGSSLWNKPLIRSQNQERCTVESLNSSQVYAVQIQCVTNDFCSRCPWSETYTVPSELTTKPVIVKISDTEEGNGKRLLYLNWEFSAQGLHDSYRLTVGKASGEHLLEQMNCTQPEIRLILSYSSYHVSISAVNNASSSPPVSLTIPQRDGTPGFADGRLKIKVYNNTSFTLYWKDDLIKTYVCYSVEWKHRGQKTQHMSFYENEKNSWDFSQLQQPLEPYKRYSITLHTRPEKQTCNIKHINNSESTYGTGQFYSMEGSPISAPTNISSFNKMLNGAMLQWSPIPEDDLRGFLMGYIIYYMEYKQMGTSAESNVTADPEFDTFQLEDLQVGTAYQVQISGFTRGGVGVRSTPYIFKTNKPGRFDVPQIGIFTIFAVGTMLLIFGSMIIKRAKVILWPSIPNPGNSNALQKAERPCEVELLQPINTALFEECDSNSFQLLEREAEVLSNTMPSLLPFLCGSRAEGSSLQTTADWIQNDPEEGTGNVRSDETTDTFSNVRQTDFQSSPLAFSSGYTTMEMFQQVTNTAVTQDAESDSEDAHWTVVKSRLDYMRQFSTSPTFSNKEVDFETTVWSWAAENEEVGTQM